MRRKTSQRRHNPYAYLRLALIGLAVGVAAYNLIQLTGAASYSRASEAESGSIAGRAAAKTDSAASGGTSVLFGSVATPTACLTPSDDRMLDQDPDDDPNKPWKRSTPELVIYFETKQLPAEYAAYAQTGASNWSASECIDARAVSSCPSAVICVPMSMSDEDAGNVVGRFSHSFNDKYIVEGKIQFFTKTLADDDSSERRMTVLHEMGHAISQNHRVSSKAIMYTPSSGKNSTAPDSTDLHNIRVVYGTSSGGANSTSPADDSGDGPIRQAVDDTPDN